MNIENEIYTEEEIEVLDDNDCEDMEMSLDDHVMIWKKQFNNIFKTVIEDEVYIWRKLKEVNTKK